MTFPSDLIMDAVAAADPEKARRAADRLAATGAGEPQTAFDTSVVQNQATGNPIFQSLQALQTAAKPSSHKAPMQPEKQFEAAIMKSFVESMLPQKADSVFGAGFAGGVCKSFLAETLSQCLSARGGIGIAAMITKRVATGGEGKAS